MFKVSHTFLIFFSGLIWLMMGCFLLPLGLNFIVEVILRENIIVQNHPILSALSPLTGGIEQAALVWIGIALMIGFLKGRYIFGKTVQRTVNRILTLPNPVGIHRVYAWPYYLLISSMVFLGMVVRYLPMDVRGGIDVIIGAALINGAMLYFRQAWLLRRITSRL